MYCSQHHDSQETSSNHLHKPRGVKADSYLLHQKSRWAVNSMPCILSCFSHITTYKSIMYDDVIQILQTFWSQQLNFRSHSPPPPSPPPPSPSPSPPPPSPPPPYPPPPLPPSPSPPSPRWHCCTYFVAFLFQYHLWRLLLGIFNRCDLHGGVWMTSSAATDTYANEFTTREWRHTSVSNCTIFWSSSASSMDCTDRDFQQPYVWELSLSFALMLNRLGILQVLPSRIMPTLAQPTQSSISSERDVCSEWQEQSILQNTRTIHLQPMTETTWGCKHQSSYVGT